jgi:predicted Zn-dependent protease
MTDNRLDTFRAMIAKNPGNVLARFGLANEAAKAGLWAEAAEHYAAYLAQYDDEGNGWQRMAEALMRLGRRDEARAAFQRGVEASRRFGHTGMAADIEAELEALDDAAS